jgi:saccharopepsin
MIKGIICRTTLALTLVSSTCYGLPRLWDFSKAPQIPLGRRQDQLTHPCWSYSACQQLFLQGAQDEVRGDGGGDMHAIALGHNTEQSKPGAPSLAHRGLVVEVSVSTPILGVGVITLTLGQHKDSSGWFYYTYISIGTPPQNFRAIIDIGWSDTFIPSVHCVDPDCAHHQLYDSARSSSYRSNGTAVHMHYCGFYTSGYASTDTLRIGDLTIENQAFEEATELKAVPLWDDSAFDSVLSLSRLEVNDPESSLRASSPFHNIISQGLLKRNLFALKLSQADANGEERERGELLFGSVNADLFVDRTMVSFHISATYSTDRIANSYLAPGWQVTAHSVAYRHGENEIANFSLAGYVAAFSTLYPCISLPRAIGESILRYLGADVLHRVECGRRESLPDLVVRLGDDAGVPFVLKPRDYIREKPQWGWSSGTCQVEMALHDETEDGVKYIILGSVFLGCCYSVFDYDNAQISCKLCL